MISRTHGFLFIHVPKTGGNSVTRALLPYAEDEVVVNRSWQDGLDRFELEHPDLPTSKHSRFTEYREYLGDELDELLVFTIVRDPWSRMLSYFFSPHRHTAAWDRDACVNLIHNRPSTLTYITLDGRDRASSLKELSTDSVLRFDYLAQDFDALSRSLGVIADLPHLNTSPRPQIHEVFDNELVELIGRRFSEEIDLFGFDPPF